MNRPSNRLPELKWLWTTELDHQGDCALLGVKAPDQLAAEETYDDWAAYHLLDQDGCRIASYDEGNGAELDSLPLAEFNPPPSVAGAAILNYTAGRWRGLREADRVAETARALSVPEKLALTAYGVPTPILGLAESYVLAEALIDERLSLICRRLRIAHAVSPRHDGSPHDDPYDYDTHLLYVAQWFSPHDEDAPLHQGVIQLGVRPMDLLLSGSHLFVADGGAQARRTAIHAFQVRLPTRD